MELPSGVLYIPQQIDNGTRGEIRLRFPVSYPQQIDHNPLYLLFTHAEIFTEPFVCPCAGTASIEREQEAVPVCSDPRADPILVRDVLELFKADRIALRHATACDPAFCQSVSRAEDDEKGDRAGGEEDQGRQHSSVGHDLVSLRHSRTVQHCCKAVRSCSKATQILNIPEEENQGERREKTTG
jgi:hypothetical protein